MSAILISTDGERFRASPERAKLLQTMEVEEGDQVPIPFHSSVMTRVLEPPYATFPADAQLLFRAIRAADFLHVDDALERFARVFLRLGLFTCPETAKLDHRLVYSPKTGVRVGYHPEVRSITGGADPYGLPDRFYNIVAAKDPKRARDLMSRNVFWASTLRPPLEKRTWPKRDLAFERESSDHFSFAVRYYSDVHSVLYAAVHAARLNAGPPILKTRRGEFRYNYEGGSHADLHARGTEFKAYMAPDGEVFERLV